MVGNCISEQWASFSGLKNLPSAILIPADLLDASYWYPQPSERRTTNMIICTVFMCQTGHEVFIPLQINMVELAQLLEQYPGKVEALSLIPRLGRFLKKILSVNFLFISQFYDQKICIKKRRYNALKKNWITYNSLVGDYMPRKNGISYLMMPTLNT